MVLIYVYKELLAIKDIRAVVAFITNQALGVVHVRVDHLHFQHVAHLTGIGPSGASALRTGCCVPASCFKLRMRAVWTQTPKGTLSSCQVYLIDRQFAAIHIETVARCKLTEGRGSGAVVFIDELFILFSGRRKFLIGLSVENRPQNDPSLRKSIVGQQSLIGQEVENVLFADLLQNGQ